MKTFLALLLVIFPILGMADAGYITWEKYNGETPQCGAGFDCGTVLNSEWASIGSIPLSAIGLLFYATIFVLAIINFLEIDISHLGTSFKKYLKINKASVFDTVSTGDILIPLSTVGFFFSIYLIIIMAHVLKAWCQFCLYSAITATLIFITTIAFYSQRDIQTPHIIKKLGFQITGFLYRHIVKRIVFLFDAENVHNFFLKSGEIMGSSALARWKTSRFFSFQHSDLKQTYAGIDFPNGVGLAAGFDYNGMLTQILPSVGFGYHTIGTVTYQSYEGNTKPRLDRFPKSKALLVNKGLKGLGARKVIENLRHLKFHIPTGISIASTNKHFDSEKDQIMDILSCFALFEKSGLQHSHYEMNISCPNTFGGEPFTHQDRLEILLQCLDRMNLSKPVFLKMPIDQSEKESRALLKVVDKHNVQGLVIGNLTKDKNNPAVSAEDREVWKKRAGNLSGRPTFERSNAFIRLTRSLYKNRFVIIGTGGVLTPENALEKLAAGADMIQLITGMIYTGPQVVGEINQKVYFESKV